MPRCPAVTLALLLVSSTASAQPAPVAPHWTAPERAAVGAQATVDTSYLLALYMAQLANSGAAPTQADIDEAARQYFTNGAAFSTVPSSGPGAAYFHNGAAAVAYPQTGSVAAAPTAPVANANASSQTAAPPAPEDPGAPSPPPPAAPIQNAAGDPQSTPPASATDDTREMEAAMAIAREFSTASPATPAPPAAPAPAQLTAKSVSFPVPPAVAVAAMPSDEAALDCSPGSFLLSRVAGVLAGALFGGLGVLVLMFLARVFRLSRKGHFPARRHPEPNHLP